MNNTIQYKGYIGSVEFSEDDAIFYGKVLGIRSLISYEGDNATDLINDFHEAVDDYLELCKQQGRKPETAFKGSFNVRISPDLHTVLAGVLRSRVHVSCPLTLKRESSRRHLLRQSDVQE